MENFTIDMHVLSQDQENVVSVQSTACEAYTRLPIHSHHSWCQHSVSCFVLTHCETNCILPSEKRRTPFQKL